MNPIIPNVKKDQTIFAIWDIIVGEFASLGLYNSCFRFIKKYNISIINAPNNEVIIDNPPYLVIILYGFFINKVIANII